MYVVAICLARFVSNAYCPSPSTLAMEAVFCKREKRGRREGERRNSLNAILCRYSPPRVHNSFRKFLLHACVGVTSVRIYFRLKATDVNKGWRRGEGEEGAGKEVHFL